MQIICRYKTYAYLCLNIKPITITDMTTAQISIESELHRRFELIENSDFRLKCSKLAEQIGISAKEWNENKVAILLHFANQYCKLENELELA